MNQPYIFAIGQSLEALALNANTLVRGGYKPVGAPFSTGNFTHPHPVLAQAMFLAPEPYRATAEEIMGKKKK